MCEGIWTIAKLLGAILVLDDCSSDCLLPTRTKKQENGNSEKTLNRHEAREIQILSAWYLIGGDIRFCNQSRSAINSKVANQECLQRLKFLFGDLQLKPY